MKANMLEYLEETAERLPDKTAFYDDQGSLSYAQLRDTARRIGSRLSAVCPPGQPVALLLDSRSIRNIPAMFGVLYAGCAYAPLDIAMPAERLRLLLNLLRPAAVLTDEKGKRALAACDLKDVPQVEYAAAVSAETDEAALAAIRRQASVYDPMSVLYTSGSTGIPKGSIQTHFSYVTWAEATNEVYGFTEDMVFGNQSPFFYANSVLDVISPVSLGATVYLLPAGVLTFPKRMIACLRDQHVTCLCMTPSSFINIVNAGVLAPGCLPELRWGIMSGESMPWPPLKTWMDATPGADWWHYYGSTEAFSVAVGRVEKNHEAGQRLPVGKPFSLVHILFLDEDGNEAAAGEPGEMLISSPWIAWGYHRDAERTNASWVVDPLKKGWQEKFFRTGDVGYLLPDGQLMVLGRRDNQIKHKGYRMELGEVEAALRSVEGIREGCVLYDRENDRIFAFYAGGPDEKELKKRLGTSLARYMLPDVFVRLGEMPHTGTMKIDRNQLKQMMG